MEGNDFFFKMCREAGDELAKGNKSWKEIDSNTLLLACFGMLINHLSHKLSSPLWFFATSVFAGIIGYLVKLFLM